MKKQSTQGQRSIASQGQQTQSNFQPDELELARIYHVPPKKGTKNPDMIGYKAYCDPESLLTLLNKPSDPLRCETLYLLLKCCAHEDVQHVLLNPVHFEKFIHLGIESKSEELRSLAFKTIATIISGNPNVKELSKLLEENEIVATLLGIMKTERSEDVLKSTFIMIMKMLENDSYVNDVLSENLVLLDEIISVSNHRNNRSIQNLTYQIMVNYPFYKSVRDKVKKQHIDPMRKMISRIHDPNIQKNDNQTLNYCLESIVNFMDDKFYRDSFIKLNGLGPLSEIFDNEDFNVKGNCLGIYCRLALDANTLKVELDSEMIEDFMMLSLDDSNNRKAIINSMILIYTMTHINNVKSYDQFRTFDIIKLLLTTIQHSSSVNFRELAISCLSILCANAHFKKQFVSHGGFNIISTYAFHGLEGPEGVGPIAMALNMLMLCFLKDEDLSDEDLIDLLTSAMTNLKLIRIESTKVELAKLAKILESLSIQVGEEYGKMLDTRELQEFVDKQPLLKFDAHQHYSKKLLIMNMDKFLLSFHESPAMSSSRDKIMFDASEDMVSKDKIIEFTKNELNEEKMLGAQMVDEIETLKKDHQVEIQKLKDENDQLKEELKVGKGNKRVVPGSKVQVTPTRGAGANRGGRGGARGGALKPPRKVVDTQDGSTMDSARGVQKLGTVASSKSVAKEPEFDQEKPEEVEDKNPESMKEQNAFFIERITQLEAELEVKQKAIDKLTHGRPILDILNETRDNILIQVEKKTEHYRAHIEKLENFLTEGETQVKDLQESYDKASNDLELTKNKLDVTSAALLSEEEKVKQLQTQVETLQFRENELQEKLIDAKIEVPAPHPKNKPLPKKTGGATIQDIQENRVFQDLQRKIDQLRLDNSKLKEEIENQTIQLRKKEIDIKGLTTETKSLRQQAQSKTKKVQGKLPQIRNLKAEDSDINTLLEMLQMVETRLSLKETYEKYLKSELETSQSALENSLRNEMILQSKLMLKEKENLGLQQTQISHSDNKMSDILNDIVKTAEDNINRFSESLEQEKERNFELYSENQVLRGKVSRFYKIAIYDASKYDLLTKNPDLIEIVPPHVTDLVRSYIASNVYGELQRLHHIVNHLLERNASVEAKLQMYSPKDLGKPQAKKAAPAGKKANTGMNAKQMEGNERKYLEQRISELRQNKRIDEYDNIIKSQNSDFNALRTQLQKQMGELALIHVDRTVDKMHTMKEFFQLQQTAVTDLETLVVKGKTEGVQISVAERTKEINRSVKQLSNIFSQVMREQESLKTRLSNPNEFVKYDWISSQDMIVHLLNTIRSLKRQLELKDDLAKTMENKILDCFEKQIESYIVNKKVQVELKYTHNLLRKRGKDNQDIGFTMGENNDYEIFEEFKEKMEDMRTENSALREKLVEAERSVRMREHDVKKKTMLIDSQDKERQVLIDKITRFEKLEKARKPLSDLKNEVEGAVEDTPQDDYIKLLIQLDQANQKNSELEYEVKRLYKSNGDKDKILAGNEESITSIIMDLEKSIRSLNWNKIEKFTDPTDITDKEKEKEELKKGLTSKITQREAERLNGLVSPESVASKLGYMSILVKKVAKRSELISETEKESQINILELQKKIQISKAPPGAGKGADSKESNSVPISAGDSLTEAISGKTFKELNQLREEKQRVEGYLQVYGNRIQTLSSIISQYQKHFKMLEQKLSMATSEKEEDSFAQYDNDANSDDDDTGLSKNSKESHKIQALQRLIRLKDVLIKQQQIELEKLKGDFVKQGIEYIAVNKDEKKQVIAMRQLDRQMKVFEQLENGFIQGEENINDGEARLEAIKSEILSIPGIIGPASYQVQKSNNSPDDPSSEKPQQIVSYRHLLKLQSTHSKRLSDHMTQLTEKFHRVFQNNFDVQSAQDFCLHTSDELKQLVALLNDNQKNVFVINKELSKLEVERDSLFEQMQITRQGKERLDQEIRVSQKENMEVKEKLQFMRQKNSLAQQEILLLNKFLNSKKSHADNFRKFISKILSEENTMLKTKIKSLAPYNDSLTLQLSFYQTKFEERNTKILSLHEKILRDQEHMISMEKNMFEMQQSVIEKEEKEKSAQDSKGPQYGKAQDKQSEMAFLENLNEALKEEVKQMREENWKLGQQLKKNRQTLDRKTDKMKNSKDVLQRYENKIKDLHQSNAEMKLKLDQFKAKENHQMTKEFKQRVQFDKPDDPKLNNLKAKLANPAQPNKSPRGFNPKAAPVQQIQPAPIQEDGPSTETTVQFIAEIDSLKRTLEEKNAENIQVMIENETIKHLLENKETKLEEIDQIRLQQREKIASLEKSMRITTMKLDKYQQKLNTNEQSMALYNHLINTILETNSTNLLETVVRRMLSYQTLIFEQFNAVKSQRNLLYEEYIADQYKIAVLKREKLRLQLSNENYKESMEHFNCLNSNMKAGEGMSNCTIAHYENHINLLQKMLMENRSEGMVNQQIQQNPDGNAQPVQQMSGPMGENSKMYGINMLIEDVPQPTAIVQTLQKQQRDAFAIQPFQGLPIEQKFSQMGGHLLHLNHFAFLECQLNEKQLRMKVEEQAKNIKTQDEKIKRQNLVGKVMDLKLQQAIKDISSERSLNLNLSTMQEFLLVQNSYLTRQVILKNALYKKLNRGNVDIQEQEMQSSNQILDIQLREVQQQLISELSEKKALSEEKVALQEQLDEIQSTMSAAQTKVVETQLEDMILYNRRLEEDLVGKQGQVDSLSKISLKVFIDDRNPILVEHQTNSSGQAMTLDAQNIQIQYDQTQELNKQLNEKMAGYETKLKQKDQKVNLLSQRVRQLERENSQILSNKTRALQDAMKTQKQSPMLTSPSSSQINFMSQATSDAASLSGKGDAIQKIHIEDLQGKLEAEKREKELMEVRMAEGQHELNDAWKQVEQMNNHKNRIMERNEELKLEIGQFKTHFQKYDTSTNKQKRENAEYYNDLLIMKEEIDQLMWKTNKLRVNLQEERLKTTTLTSQNKDLQDELHQQRISRTQLEQQNIRLQDSIDKIDLENQSGKQLDSKIDLLLKKHTEEILRLRIENIENSADAFKFKSENGLLEKLISEMQLNTREIVDKEIGMKAQLNDLKLQIIELKVQGDMNDYNKQITKKDAGGSSAKKPSKSKAPNDEFLEMKEKLMSSEQQMAKLQEEIQAIQQDYQSAFADAQSKAGVITNLKRELESKSDIQLIGRDSVVKGDQDAGEKVLELNRAVVSLNQRISELRIELETKDRQVQQSKQQLRSLKELERKYETEKQKNHKLEEQVIQIERNQSIKEEEKKQLEDAQSGEPVEVDYKLVKANLERMFENFQTFYHDTIQGINFRKNQYKVKFEEGLDQVFDSKLKFKKLCIRVDSLDEQLKIYQAYIDKFKEEQRAKLKEQLSNPKNNDVSSYQKLQQKLAIQTSDIDTLKLDKHMLEQNLTEAKEIYRSYEQASHSQRQTIQKLRDELNQLKSDNFNYSQRLQKSQDEIVFDKQIIELLIQSSVEKTDEVQAAIMQQMEEHIEELRRQVKEKGVGSMRKKKGLNSHIDSGTQEQQEKEKKKASGESSLLQCLSFEKRELIDKIDSLRTKLKDSSNALIACTNELNTVEVKNKEIQKTMELFQVFKNNLGQYISAHIAESSKAKEKGNSNLEYENQKLRSENGVLRDRTSELEDNIINMRNDMKEFNSSKEDILQRMGHLEEENDILQGRLMKKKEKQKELKSQNQALNTKHQIQQMKEEEIKNALNQLEGLEHDMKTSVHQTKALQQHVKSVNQQTFYKPGPDGEKMLSVSDSLQKSREEFRTPTPGKPIDIQRDPTPTQRQRIIHDPSAISGRGVTGTVKRMNNSSQGDFNTIPVNPMSPQDSKMFPHIGRGNSSHGEYAEASRDEKPRFKTPHVPRTGKLNTTIDAPGSGVNTSFQSKPPSGRNAELMPSISNKKVLSQGGGGNGLFGNKGSKFSKQNTMRDNEPFIPEEKIRIEEDDQDDFNKSRVNNFMFRKL